MTILIDPHLLVAPPDTSSLEEEDFWKRIVAIDNRRNLQLGYEGFHWIIQQLEKVGYPAQRVRFGPPNFSRECQIAIESILTRVSRGTSEAADGEFSPRYMGSPDAALSLVIDVTEHDASLHALLSDHAHWAEPVSQVRIHDLVVEVLVDPQQEPAATEQTAVAECLSFRRIHILGGSRATSVIEAIERELGVPPERVHWVQSEVSKPPRNLDKTWAGLRADRDITICNTARIGHKSWEKGDLASARCGIKMLECNGQGQIVSTIRSWAVNELARAEAEAEMS